MHDGGPAFPRDSYTDKECGLVVTQNGMSLRDYFAGLAMEGILSNPALVDLLSCHVKALVAEHANEMADTMLKAREVTHE